MAGQVLTREQLLELSGLWSSEFADLLYCACQVRLRHFGRQVSTCSIIAGKFGGCTEDCHWCAQSAGSAASETPPARRAEMAEIQLASCHAKDHAAGCFCIVNAGRRPSPRDLTDAAAAAKAVHGCLAEAQSPMYVSASLGELNDRQAAELAGCGVRRYNHNLETSRRFFPHVVTTHTYDDRLATLDRARRAGMELCCGGIFGLGETWEDRIDLAITLRDQVRPQTVPMNFLHPIPGTKLADAQTLQPREILSIIAIFRLAMPTTDLKIAGGRANLRDMQSWIFHAGATSCLVGNYLATAGRPAGDDLAMFADLGLELVPHVKLLT